MTQQAHQQKKELNLEFPLLNQQKYNVECPRCSDSRDKTSTKTLTVYRDKDGYVRWQCSHAGQCEWNERQFMRDPDQNFQAKVVDKTESLTPRDIKDLPETIDGNKVYWFKNTDGLVLFGEMRFKDKKSFVPVLINDDLTFKYTGVSWPNVKALFGAEHLAGKDTVIVVEGPKAAALARSTFSKAAIVSWRGGANNVKSGDWDLLKGKDVILWPDNDEPGKEAMRQIGDLLPVLAYRIAYVDHLPTKADLGDNLSREQVIEAVKMARKVTKIVTGRMTFEELEAQHETMNHRLHTGIEVIDSNVKLPMTGVVVLEARTKNGKTASAVYLTHKLLQQGKTVGFFSYEIPASRVIARYVRCTHPDIPLETVFKSTAMQEFKELIDTKLLIYDQSAQLDIDKLVSVLDSPAWHGSVVVIDYIQIVPMRGADRQVAIKTAMDKLRVISNTHGFLILLLSQLTPNPANPLLDAPREARDIHFSAEAVIRMWYKDVEQAHNYYDQVTGNYTMHLLLNRDGEAGTVIGFDFTGGAAFKPTGDILKALKVGKKERDLDNGEVTMGQMKNLIKGINELAKAMMVQKEIF